MVVEITQQEKSTVSITFYVKEGENSPYQGLLQYDADTYAKLTPEDIEAAQIEQFQTWKARTEMLRNAPPPTKEELAQQAIDLQEQAELFSKQIDELKLDPAVAAAIETKRPVLAKAK